MNDYEIMEHLDAMNDIALDYERDEKLALWGYLREYCRQNELDYDGFSIQWESDFGWQVEVAQ